MERLYAPSTDCRHTQPPWPTPIPHNNMDLPTTFAAAAFCEFSNSSTLTYNINACLITYLLISHTLLRLHTDTRHGSGEVLDAANLLGLCRVLPQPVPRRGGAHPRHARILLDQLALGECYITSAMQQHMLSCRTSLQRMDEDVRSIS